VLRNGVAAMWKPSGSTEKDTGSFGQEDKQTYNPTRTVNPSDSIALPDILPRIASGEDRAMRECIDRYGNLVWGIVRRYVKDSTESEDVVQEVFTEIWKKAGQYSVDAGSESTYIGMITRRRSIDHLRRKGRQPDFESLEAAQSVEVPRGENKSNLCDPEVVKSSVAVLPEDTQQLFQLFFEDGFTHPEIAEKTGLPLGTVKTRLRRGLISLREHLRRTVQSNIQPAS
jgi:RNA polymerase sigma-70 factor (ECF subfamily)